MTSPKNKKNFCHSFEIFPENVVKNRLSGTLKMQKLQPVTALKSTFTGSLPPNKQKSTKNDKNITRLIMLPLIIFNNKATDSKTDKNMK